MTKKEIAWFAVEALEKEYPQAECSLHADNPVELIIATRLSAQCTDARVNLVTPKLFEKYKSLEDFAAADISELEDIVRPCGFYHLKAADIKAMAKMLLEEYGGAGLDYWYNVVLFEELGRCSCGGGKI